MKSIALKKIIAKITDKPFLQIANDLVVIDLSVLRKDDKASQLEKIKHVYVDEYCQKAETFMRTASVVGQRMKRENILSFLQKKSAQKKLKTSINDFIGYELPLYKSEMDMENKFLKDVQNRINAKDFTKINICNVKPFFSLNTHYLSCNENHFDGSVNNIALFWASLSVFVFYRIRHPHHAHYILLPKQILTTLCVL